MSDPKSPQDLSMDEILATIRRIIAEDERSSSTASRGVTPGVSSPGISSPGVSSPGVSSPGVSDRGAAGGPREAKQAPAAAAGASDVLDLTDALDEGGGEPRPAPIETAPGVPAQTASAPVAMNSAEPMPLEAKPAETSPGPDRPIPAEASPRPDRLIPAEASPRTERPIPAEANPEADRTIVSGPSPAAAQPPGATDERLLSDVAALAAATAFGRLAAVPRTRREPPLVGGRPLDDIVRDLLRPLLQTWLDEHLPGLVERLVQEEIARISARSGTG